MQERTCFISTAPSFSLNLPRYKISSKSSPPLQILRNLVSGLKLVLKYLLSDKVVALLILEEFVHFNDVRVVLHKSISWVSLTFSSLLSGSFSRLPPLGNLYFKSLGVFCSQTDLSRSSKLMAQLELWIITYDFLKDVDLIEEHTLLFLVHVALPKHFDGSLCCRFPVYAHANLSECA